MRLRKPTKLGVSAPWVRFDMRDCECVAKTWRYFVSRILLTECFATGSGVVRLYMVEEEEAVVGMAGAAEMEVEVAVSVRVDMAGSKRRGGRGEPWSQSPLPEGWNLWGRGKCEVGCGISGSVKGGSFWTVGMTEAAWLAAHDRSGNGRGVPLRSRLGRGQTKAAKLLGSAARCGEL